jgi:hypothetical protein
MWNSKMPIFLHHFVESLSELSRPMGVELLAMLERHHSMDEGTEPFLYISFFVTDCCTALGQVVLHLAKHRECLVGGYEKLWSF